jgi:hypothetical protein
MQGGSQAGANGVYWFAVEKQKGNSVKIISVKPSVLILSLLAFATISILGCGGVSSSPVTATASTHPGTSLSGQVQSGSQPNFQQPSEPQPGVQQPISNATIQLYQVGTAGDGSSAATLGSSTTTGPTGAFNITGDYTCPGSDPLVYLLATGGNPGLAVGTNNTAINLIAALGSCNSLPTRTAPINMNEVTTVAAVAALAPYMTSPTSIGSGTSDASGLTSAFTLASQYANTATGTSPGTSVPAGDAVPSTLINSLAGIVSACVNSTGGVAGDGSSCGTLFTDSTPSGGAAPANVATALLNILNNPTSDPNSLFALLPPTPPFQPVLNTAPSSWEISLTVSNCSSPTTIGSFTNCGNFFVHGGTGIDTLTTPYSPTAGNGVLVHATWCGHSDCGGPFVTTITATISDNVNSPETCFHASPNAPYYMDNSSVPDYPTGYAWYCPSIPSGVTSFTVTTSGTGSSGTTFLTMSGSEWQTGSIAATGYFESVDQGISSNNTPSLIASVPTSAGITHTNDLVVSSMSNCGGIINIEPGAGFTALVLNPTDNPGFITEAAAASSSGVQTATASWSGTTASGNCQLGDTGGLDTWYGFITPMVANSSASQ